MDSTVSIGIRFGSSRPDVIHIGVRRLAGVLLLALACLMFGPTVASVSAAGARFVTGTVTDGSNTPLQNICVDAYDSAGDSVGAAIYTDRDGTYTRALASNASYRLQFSDCLGTGKNVLGEFYDDKATLAAATPITVNFDQTVTANAQLATGGSITGTVTNSSGTPLKGCDLSGRPSRSRANGATSNDGTAPG